MLNLEHLEHNYFWFDEPVDYKIDDNQSIKIYPILLKDSEIFISSISIFDIDKNASPDPTIISMPYLQFMFYYLLKEKDNLARFINILKLCLGWDYPKVYFDEKGKPQIFDEKQNIIIKPKQFEEIRKIILHQNFLHYDDEYINPDVKKAMEEYDSVVNKGIELLTAERKMSIITAHCGLPKAEQLKMTYRAFESLFEEVYGEVEFTTLRPIALLANMFSKQKAEEEHWIFRKTKNKYDKYFVADSTYNRSMGGDGNIRVTNQNPLSGLSLQELLK